MIKTIICTTNPHYKQLMKLFADVFDDQKSYQSALPSDQYINDFLQNRSNIMLVAIDQNDAVVGGLMAYELQKFEQARREIYMYDLAVSIYHQRKGIGTSLVKELKNIAQQRGVNTIFVQADESDDCAVSFYRSLTNKEIIAHQFDIDV